MGDVYKAEDTSLHRTVALKFLAPERLREDLARSRFLQEARSASALDHPNICTIYEIDETEDGRLYIAMGYYEGETLGDRMSQGVVPLTQALDFTTQLLSGLGAAHARGICHRDIKPANIVITQGEETVKILDFGLAKFQGSQKITREGIAVGTPAYMSPEQVYGREVDGRADLWSVGVLLYEMVTGKLPFDKPDDLSMLHSIAFDDPQPLAGLPTRHLMLIGPIVRQALAKEVAQRYASAEVMLQDLRQLEGQLSGRLDVIGVGPSQIGSTGALAPTAETKTTTIAVLPFADLSPEGDQQYFCSGMAEELASGLARLEGMRVASRSSASRLMGQDLDITEIGAQLNVGAVLEGSVRKAGSRVRITAQLTEVSTGLSLWSGRFDRELTDVFELQDEISEEIVQTVKGKFASTDQMPALPHPTENLEAYNAYLRGRFFWNRRTQSGLRKGIEFFQQAIEADPLYSRAHAGLADSYVIQGVYGGEPPRNVMPKARAAALEALRLDPSLAEAHTSLACVQAVFDWDWNTAENGFRRAIELDPDYATARQWYAMNLLTPRRRFDEAHEQLEKAQELEPLSTVISTSRGLLELYRGNLDLAVEIQLKTLELDPNFAIAHYFLGITYEARGSFEDAIAELETSRGLSRESNEILAALAATRARSGDLDRAKSLTQTLLSRFRRGYVSATLLAQIYAAKKDRQRTLEWIHKAHHDQAAELIWIGLRPVFGWLRGDPSFDSLLRTLGLD
jgi:serine/threonine-protein kinase